MEAVNPLHKEFERCRKWIEDALQYNYGELSLNDVYNGIMEGQYWLVGGKRSAWVIELAHFPQTKNIHFMLGGGDFSEMVELEKPIIEWGKKNGYNKLTLWGRKGWERRLPEYGYKATLVKMEKDI